MKIYDLSPQGIAREKRKGLIRGIATAIFGVALGVGIPAIAGSVPIWFVVSLLPLFALIFYFSFRRALGRLEENWSSYQLLVGSDTIVRKQVRLPDLEIHRDQVTKLQEKAGTGLFIKAQEKRLSIYVPATLEGYDELRDLLSHWGGPGKTSSTNSFSSSLQILAVVSFGAGFAIMWLSKNLALIITAGAYVIVYMLWASILLRQRKDIDPRLKLSIWKIVIIVLAFALMLYGRINSVLNK
jgi:hypothetical protein